MVPTYLITTIEIYTLCNLYKYIAQYLIKCLVPVGKNSGNGTIGHISRLRFIIFASISNNFCILGLRKDFKNFPENRDLAARFFEV